jgi:hypothetical protein
MKFDLIDPLNMGNNMGGKETKIESLQAMFKSINYALNMKVNSSVIDYVLELHKIF